MKSKQISMKLSDYFEIKKPKYTYLKLIPSTSIKNNKACDIASIINDVYVEINQRFIRKNKGFTYNLPSKVSFIIDINKDGEVESVTLNRMIRLENATENKSKRNKTNKKVLAELKKYIEINEVK